MDKKLLVHQYCYRKWGPEGLRHAEGLLHGGVWLAHLRVTVHAVLPHHLVDAPLHHLVAGTPPLQSAVAATVVPPPVAPDDRFLQALSDWNTAERRYTIQNWCCLIFWVSQIIIIDRLLLHFLVIHKYFHKQPYSKKPFCIYFNN